MSDLKTWKDAVDALGEKIVRIPWNACASEILSVLRAEYAEKIPEINDRALDRIAGQYGSSSTDDAIHAIGRWLDDHSVLFGYLLMPEESYCSYLSYDYDSAILLRCNPHLCDKIQVHAVCSEDECMIHFPHETVQIKSRIFGACGQNCHRSGNYLYAVYRKDHPLFRVHPFHVYDIRRWPIRELEIDVTYDARLVLPIHVSFRTESGEEMTWAGQDPNRLELDPVMSSGVQGNDSSSDIPSIQGAYFMARVGSKILYCCDPMITNRRQYQFSDCHSKAYPFQDTGSGAQDEYAFNECVLIYDTETRLFVMTSAPDFILNARFFAYSDEWVILFQRHSFHADLKVLFWNIVTNTYYSAYSEKSFMRHVLDIFRLEDGSAVFELDNGSLIKAMTDLPSWWMEHQSSTAHYDFGYESNRRYEAFTKAVSDTIETKVFQYRYPADRFVVEFDNGCEIRVNILKF